MKGLENVLEACKSRLTLVQRCRLWFKGANKGTDKTYMEFCKKVLRISRFVAKGLAESETARASRSYSVISKILKYWLTVLHMENKEPIRVC
jgi:hypothetical protein